MATIGCLRCAKDDFVVLERGVVICKNCESEYTIAPHQTRSDDPPLVGVEPVGVDRLLFLAQAARSSANRSQEFEYASRVLELDPANAQALYMKGEASGFLSNARNPRFKEMLFCFREALRCASSEERHALSEDVSRVANQVITWVSNDALSNLRRHPRLDGAWEKYYNLIHRCVDAYQQAHDMVPSEQMAKNVLVISKNVLDGHSYEDSVVKKTRSRYVPTAGQQEAMLSAIAWAAARL